MCLLFVYINPCAKEGEYKIVLVNNRDEFYARPAKPAHFWDSRILGGMDVEKGREGGTWLGVEESGRIACLLNIFQPKDAFLKDGAGRGFVVVNYLLGKEIGLEYVENISKSGVTYNPFNLVTMEPTDTTYKVTFYSDAQKAWQSVEPGFHGYGNCPVDKPFNKLVKGKGNFQKIIEMYGKTDSEDQLITELNLMMQDSEETLPDGQLSEQGRGHPAKLIKGLSGICVKCAFMGYGTRTTTTILVDHNDRVAYREQTMKEPIDIENVEWEVSEHSFKRKLIE